MLPERARMVHSFDAFGREGAGAVLLRRGLARAAVGQLNGPKTEKGASKSAADDQDLRRFHAKSDKWAKRNSKVIFRIAS